MTQIQQHVHILVVLKTLDELHNVRVTHHSMDLDLGVELWDRVSCPGVSLARAQSALTLIFFFEESMAFL